jgi:hypothetical protein
VAQAPALGIEHPVVVTKTVCVSAVVDVGVDVPLIACVG